MKESRHSGSAREGSACRPVASDPTCRPVAPDPKYPLEGGGDIHSLLDLLYNLAGWWWWWGILDLRGIAPPSRMK